MAMMANKFLPLLWDYQESTGSSFLTILIQDAVASCLNYAQAVFQRIGSGTARNAGAGKDPNLGTSCGALLLTKRNEASQRLL